MLHVLLFVGVCILGFFLTIVANPAFSFVLYEAVYFFSPLERWWSYYLPDFRYSFMTVMLMLVAVLIRKNKHQSGNSLLAAPQFKWLYALLILFGIASFYAVFPNEHQEALTNYLKLVIIISVAYKLIDDARSLDYALWGFVFGSWYISFLIFQTGRNSYDRVEGIGTVDSPDANGIAAAIAPSLVVCLYYFWVKSNAYIKFIFAFAGVFIANAIILINSRGSFLGVGMSILFFVYYLFFASFQRRFQKAMAVGLVVAGFAGLIYLADESFVSRVYTMQDTEITLEEQTATSRFVFWSAALKLGNDRPFGSGYKGFDFYAPIYLPEDMNTGSSRSRSVHSTWFQVLSEIGYLGLLIFVLMIYSSFRALRLCMVRMKGLGDYESYYKAIMLQAALLCFLISMTFMNRFGAEILYWLILYSACAYKIFVIQPSHVIHE
jgi:hypothetical protein